jgi:hypothetical protein
MARVVVPGCARPRAVRRLELPSPPPDPWLKALPILRHGTPAGQPIAKLQLEVPLGASRDDLREAVMAMLDAYGLGLPVQIPAKTGRQASRDRLKTQMLGITLRRLRKHFSAPDTLLLLESTGWAGSYCDESSLDHAWRNAKEDQCAFSLLAKKAINDGRWGFPLGNEILVI